MKFRNALLFAFLCAFGIQSQFTCAQDKISKDAYLKAVSKQFRRAYFSFYDYGFCVAKIQFVIDENGKVSQIKIVKHAVSRKYKTPSITGDESMIFAAKNMSNLPKMPDEIKSPALILLTLDGTGKEGPIKIDAHVLSSGK